MARLVGWGEEAWRPAPAPAAGGMRWPAAMALSAALSLWVASLAANASRGGVPHAVEAYYAALSLAFLPFAYRTLDPRTPRAEHLANVALLTLALYLARVIREPVAFVDHDEFLHWATADAITATGRLFSPNPLLPVSPLYPGLELVATAITSLSGMSLFHAAVLLLAAARLAFVLALFLVYERVSRSAGVAAMGCLAYMGASTFLVFDTQFSYESLAVTFLAAALLAEARARPEGGARHLAFVLAPLLGALAVTHHMTAFLCAGLMAGLAALETVRLKGRGIPALAIAAAAMAVALPLAWSGLVGNPTAGYLGPVLESGIREVAQLATLSTGRTLFVSEDGAVAPAWQRLVGIGSVAVTCLGLLAGFPRCLAMAGLPTRWRTLSSARRLLGWDDSRLVLMSALTLLFPLSVLFRLTRSGWEIGNRVGPFSFLGVGLVLAVGTAAYWRAGAFPRLRRAALACAALVLVTGGVISSQGPRVLVPGTFRVSADAASIGPMGISAAEWARDWLGEGNLFAADRINRLLLATYGRQDVASSLQDGVAMGEAFLAPAFGPREVALLRQGGVDYLSVDLRLTTGLPVVGNYFDGGESDRGYRAPPRAEAFQKFDRIPGVGRVFDDGFIVTYDVRSIDARR